MKKLIPILLVLCLLAAPMTAQVSADDHSQTTAVPVMQETTNPDVAFLNGTVPAESELTEAILLPIHALVLSLWEHEQTYDPQSSSCVWNALYYALSLYGEADSRAQLSDEALLLPSEAVNDFSRALFANLDTIPPIPADSNAFVSFDTATDTFALAIGDFALTQVRLDALTAQPDKTFTLDGSIVSCEDNTTLLSFRAVLAENDTMFGFSILDVSLS